MEEVEKSLLFAALSFRGERVACVFDRSAKSPGKRNVVDSC